MKTHQERDSVLKSNCLNELDIFIAKIYQNTLQGGNLVQKPQTIIQMIHGEANDKCCCVLNNLIK